MESVVIFSNFYYDDVVDPYSIRLSVVRKISTSGFAKIDNERREEPNRPQRVRTRVFDDGDTVA
jgi:hypothetical protein